MIFKERIFLFTSKESKENVHGSLKKKYNRGME